MRERAHYYAELLNYLAYRVTESGKVLIGTSPLNSPQLAIAAPRGGSSSRGENRSATVSQRLTGKPV
ncbi:MAG: hypothetical protein QW096_11720 [Thermofilaceae archaeon]